MAARAADRCGDCGAMKLSVTATTFGSTCSPAAASACSVAQPSDGLLLWGSCTTGWKTQPQAEHGCGASTLQAGPDMYDTTFTHHQFQHEDTQHCHHCEPPLIQARSQWTRGGSRRSQALPGASEARLAFWPAHSPLGVTWAAHLGYWERGSAQLLAKAASQAPGHLLHRPLQPHTQHSDASDMHNRAGSPYRPCIALAYNLYPATGTLRCHRKSGCEDKLELSGVPNEGDKNTAAVPASGVSYIKLECAHGCLSMGQSFICMVQHTWAAAANLAEDRMVRSSDTMRRAMSCIAQQGQDKPF